MTRNARRVGVLLAGVLACGTAGPARAVPEHVLGRLPPERLMALAPLLDHSDMALVESCGDGTMKQVTVMMLVAASPEIVHQVIASPGEYKRFIPNLSKSTWEKGPDGRMLSAWRLELPFTEIGEMDSYDFEAGETAPVNLHAVDNNDEGSYRWELYGVPSGTVLVQYGYTDVKHSNQFIRGFVSRQPTMEHGLALAAQLVLTSAIRREAERRSRRLVAPSATRGSAGDFDFLLERGQVAILRSHPDGRLSDISVLDRVYKAAARVRQVILEPSDYARFIPGISKSYVRAHSGPGLVYATEMSIPFISWDTTWSMRADAGGIDAIGIGGDLRGARYRWDVLSKGREQTLVVYRSNQSLGASTFILRELIKREPTLEHGLNVAFGLVYMRAIRGRAEGWPGYTK